MDKLKIGIILCIVFITIILIILINLNNTNLGNNIMSNEVENKVTHVNNIANINVENSITGEVNVEMPNTNEIINSSTPMLNNDDESFEDTTNEIDSTMKKSRIRNLYFSIEKSINGFFKYVDFENEEIVYSILSNKYINEKDITSKNVLKRIEREDGFLSFKVEEVYTIERLGSYSNFVKGEVTYKDKQENWYGLVEVDTDYKYYQITPYSEDEYLNKVNNVKDVEVSKIKNNEYNIMSIAKISDEEMCRKYFDDYKEKILNNTEKAYEILDKEYKNKNFKEFSEYENYISSKRDIIKTSTLIEYEVNTVELGDNYEYMYEYILKDNNGNVYIITENAIMDYTVKMEK